MSNKYLEQAKKQIEPVATEDDVELTKAFALIAIAEALEKIVGKLDDIETALIEGLPK